MNLLTPFDLVERFAESQDLAIVGNARSDAGASLGVGERIDGSQVVACVVAGEPDPRRKRLGVRTDILVTGGDPLSWTLPSPGGNGVAPLVLAIWPLAPADGLGAGEEADSDADVLFTYSPCLVGVPNSTHYHALSTRVAAVQLLCRLLVPKSVLITGFSLTEEQPGGDKGWWSRWLPLKSRRDPRSGSPEEAILLCRVINKIRVPVSVTPDVANIFARTGTKLGKRVGVVDR